MGVKELGARYFYLGLTKKECSFSTLVTEEGGEEEKFPSLPSAAGGSAPLILSLLVERDTKGGTRAGKKKERLHAELISLRCDEKTACWFLFHEKGRKKAEKKEGAMSCPNEKEGTPDPCLIGERDPKREKIRPSQYPPRTQKEDLKPPAPGGCNHFRGPGAERRRPWIEGGKKKRGKELFLSFLGHFHRPHQQRGIRPLELYVAALGRKEGRGGDPGRYTGKTNRKEEPDGPTGRYLA